MFSNYFVTWLRYDMMEIHVSILLKIMSRKKRVAVMYQLIDRMFKEERYRLSVIDR